MKSFDKIRVGFLAAGKKVIPLTYSMGEYRVTNIKLPDVAVYNESKHECRIAKIEIIGKAGGENTVIHCIPEKIFSPVIKRTSKMLSELIKAGPGIKNQLGITFGEMNVALEKLSADQKIQPGENALVPLSSLLYLNYIGRDRIDSLDIILTIRAGAKTRHIEFPVNLTYYKLKGSYVFPLAGDVFIANLPMNLEAHRSVMSQEFAFDVVSCRQDKKFNMTTTSNADSKDIADYFIYKRDLLAIGDGTVVETANAFPEDMMRDTGKYTEEFFKKLMKKLFPQIGYLNALCGNYVIIDHHNGEFSLYAHMSRVDVKKGDVLKKKQIIGKVGNTGHSTEPHLHFQLMDAANFYCANSLPVIFKNLPSQFNEANSLMFSDCIIENIK